MKIIRRNLVYLAALTYVLITGLSFLFTKIALKTGEPIDILAHRFNAAFIAMLISMTFPCFKVSYKKEQILKILPLALLYPLTFFTLQTMGLLYATSSEAGIISASAPIFTLLGASYFLKEKSNTMQGLSIVISVSGVIYVAVMRGATLDISNLLGIILLTLSAITIAAYNVLARILTKSFSNIELSSVMITISFICYNTVSIAKHLLNGNIKDYFTPFHNISYIVAIVYLGVLSSLVSSLLTNYMLSKLEATRAGVFTNLGTVVTIVAGVLVLKEKIHYYHIIGTILIVGGVIGANYFKHTPSKRHECNKIND